MADYQQRAGAPAIGKQAVEQGAGHTPGPWGFDGICQIFEKERPHMRVAFLPSDHHEYASSVANGSLIAAAPEMLEALRQLVSAMPRYNRDEWPVIAEAMNVARAAIAKATGAA